ncbi:MAG TPA: RNase adapter RapZ [Clostridia bacterium]|nr:RNase adapter RapZ [Clostridia bacterium]
MELLIVTGLSGAGKSQALRKLEDIGFFCVDNLPCEMLQGFAQLCLRAQPEVKRAAVVIDSRESIFKADMERSLKELQAINVHDTILFLECRDEVLVRRYNETRRRHPLASEIEEGIRLEREMLGFFRDRANCILDTSDMKPLELSAKIESLYSETAADEFCLIFESFGYKRGVPFEADIVFDMRFLPNPYYEPELRSLSGRDAKVRDFIRGNEMYDYFISTVKTMLDKLIPQFRAQGRQRLLVAFGCTGGRHRSVCAAEELYGMMKDSYGARLIHRDARLEADDIDERFNMKRGES